MSSNHKVPISDAKIQIFSKKYKFLQNVYNISDS